MKISAQEHYDALAFFSIGPSGNTLEESIQVCKWLVEAGRRRDPRLHRRLLPASAESGGHRPAGRAARHDLRLDDLERRARPSEPTCCSGTLPTLARKQWNEAAPKPDEIEGPTLAGRAAGQGGRDVPVICTGGFQTASVIAAAIERGDCDAVSIARPLVANNDLVRGLPPRPGSRRSPVHLLQQVPRQRRREPARLLRRDRGFPRARR